MTREEQIKGFSHARLSAMDNIRRDKRLTSSDSLVGIELYSRLDFRTRAMVPTDVEYLAEKLGLGERTVKRAIAKLKAAGWIEVAKEWKFNRYRPPAAFFDQGPNWHPIEQSQGPEGPVTDDLRGQNVHSQGPKTTDLRGQNGPHLLSLEDSFDLSSEAPGAAGTPPDGAAGPGSKPSFDLGLPGVALRRRLGDDAFRSWLGKVAVVSIGEHELVLQAPTRFIASRLENDYGEALLEAWRAQHPALERVRFEIAPAEAAAPRPEHPDARWLIDVGIALVADQLGKSREHAAEEITAWLKLTHGNAAALKDIIVGAVRWNLHGTHFAGKVRQEARNAPQGQLKFGPEDRLKKRSAS